MAHVNGALARGAELRTGSACSSGRPGRTACACGPTAARSRPSGSCSPPAPSRRRSRGCRRDSSSRRAQVLAWLEPLRPELFAPRALPRLQPRARRGAPLRLPGVHGVPGFKVGLYDHHGVGGDPDSIPRDVSPEDEAPLRAVRGALLPGRRGADARRSRRASSSSPRTSTSSSTATRRPISPSSAPASRATASSSARSSARSSPTSRSTARRATTSASSVSIASRIWGGLQRPGVRLIHTGSAEA